MILAYYNSGSEQHFYHYFIYAFTQSVAIVSLTWHAQKAIGKSRTFCAAHSRHDSRISEKQLNIICNHLVVKYGNVMRPKIMVKFIIAI